MYVYSESNAVCTMPEGKFEYACLKESYGGNLALSWTFRGEAEGFLIYDADSGRLIREVCDGLGHYLLLKNQPQGIHLIVKAYVRAVKGKIVIAESDVAAVSQKSQGQNLVSLIMPAYNAEEYIARSIDTALAQSFADMEVIIVDEPTSGIDPAGVREFMDLIHQLSHEEGLTVLFSSHHLDQVQQVCNRVGLFSSGKLLADIELTEQQKKEHGLDDIYNHYFEGGKGHE